MSIKDVLNDTNDILSFLFLNSVYIAQGFTWLYKDL